MRRRRGSGRTLHVLLTTDVVGGVWDFCVSLAAELVQAGHRVTLLAFGTPAPNQRQQATERGAALLAAPLKLEWMQDSAADVGRAGELTERLARELEPDVVHVNQFGLARIRTDAPIVLSAHSDVLSWIRWTERGGEHAAVPSQWSQYAGLVRHGLRAADAVVAVSRFLADELRELYRVDRPIPVIHNGWPGGRREPRPIGQRPNLTLLAGRAWDSAKNVRLVAPAARGWSPGRVVLAGEQRHPELGSVLEVEPPIEPLGRLPRQAIDDLLGQARLYLAPARYEPFGLLPLQAALAGCPLLLSDIPSFRELWDGAALLFRSDDAADLRRQWARLLSDQALAADLAGRARRRALERYGAERMAEEYLALYWRSRA